MTNPAATRYAARRILDLLNARVTLQAAEAAGGLIPLPPPTSIEVIQDTYVARRAHAILADLAFPDAPWREAPALLYEMTDYTPLKVALLAALKRWNRDAPGLLSDEDLTVDPPHPYYRPLVVTACQTAAPLDG